MTQRDLMIWGGVGLLALAALALTFAVRAVWRRRRAGQPQRRIGLAVRGVVFAGLLAAGTANLLNAPPPEMVNHPAPAAPDTIVAYVPSPRNDYQPSTVIGVSARDGATRWRRTLANEIEALMPATPNTLLAQTFGADVYALRLSDGATVWHTALGPSIPSTLVTTDGARVYAITQASPPRGTGAMDAVALDLATGVQVWRAPLPANMSQFQRLAVGDGLFVVAGEAGQSTDFKAPWGVVAFDAQRGAPRWSTAGEITSGVYDRLIVRLDVTQGMVVVTPQQGAIVGLRARDGAVIWGGSPGLTPKNPPPFYAQGPPTIIAATVSGDTLYARWWPLNWPTDANGKPVPPPMSLSAVDVTSGAVRWQRTVPDSSSARAALAMRDGVLLSGNSVTPEFGYSGYDPTASQLFAYDAATGQPLWQDNTPVRGVSWDMSPLMTPLAGDGAAYLLGIQADPFIQDRFMCVIFCPGVSWVYAVNLRTGAPWWRIRAGYVTLGHLVY